MEVLAVQGVSFTFLTYYHLYISWYLSRTFDCWFPSWKSQRHFKINMPQTELTSCSHLGILLWFSLSQVLVRNTTETPLGTKYPLNGIVHTKQPEEESNLGCKIKYKHGESLYLLRHCIGNVHKWSIQASQVYECIIAFLRMRKLMFRAVKIQAKVTSQWVAEQNLNLVPSF